jgi:adenine specific DNA methylase Mod
MSKEEKFFNALKDIFVGAKVEGESGYINLIRIKSRYYEQGVFPKLQQDINKATEIFSEFREELFDKLFTFFESYFSESGSIYFRYTPIHKNVYEKVYTDDKDVMLFWKTHMLYYVKTDRLFKNLEVRLPAGMKDDESENKGDYKFFFDVSTLQHKKANEKREVIYEFKEIRKDNVPVFNVSYSERNRITKLKEIIKALKKEGIEVNEDILEKAFRVFEKQSEVDYFINKNAREFLREQFNMWLYQYVYSGESDWTEKRIEQLQILKEIAFKIIDFISQFEDELVRIWNKPKFVRNSNYVISLDKLVPDDNSKGQNDKSILLIEKILCHESFQEQINEWKELRIVDDSFDKNEIIEVSLVGKHLNPKYKFLPIDTKYFKDLELEILSLFEDLDNSLDGWLIKSENYQALNTILPKFKEKVQTIYIDPPFNLDSSDQFLYRTNYKDANWATLLENRLQVAKEWLNKKGNIFVRCDYNGNWIVRPLMNNIFGEENFRNDLCISRISKQDPKARRFNTSTDSLFFFSRSNKFFFKLVYKQLSKPKEERWHAMDSQGQGQALYIFGYLLDPPKGRHWTYGQKNIRKMEKEESIRIKCKNCGFVHKNGIWEKCPKCSNKDNIKVEYLLAPTEYKQIDSNWTDVSGYTSNWNFPTENSEILLDRVMHSTSQEGDFVMDFFLGSGTTTAVAHKLKRKWIGVEMGEHFNDVVLPRMKKVLSYDKSGISKDKSVREDYNEKNAGGFFKYYELEHYEDTLRKVKYKDTDLFDNPDQSPYNQYIFMKDSKLLEAIEVDYENNKVKVNFSKLYPNIDIPETLSNLLGKWIKKITPDYVEFEDGEKLNINNLDYKIIKPLIWW